LELKSFSSVDWEIRQGISGNYQDCNFWFCPEWRWKADIS